MEAAMIEKRLKEKLSGSLFGREVLYFHTIDSTNRVLRQHAHEGGEEGLLAVARNQEEGRGRRGRIWFSPPGGLYFSFLLRPSIDSPSLSFMPILVSFILAQWLRQDFSLPAMIKWPNDVLLKGRKLAGILMERAFDEKKDAYLIVGIGLNVNQKREDFPPNLREVVTSLQEETEREYDLHSILVEFLLRFQEEYRRFLQKDLDLLKQDSFFQCSATLGQEVFIKSTTLTYAGKALEITPRGSLLVHCNDGVKREFFQGDVTIRGKGENFHGEDT